VAEAFSMMELDALLMLTLSQLDAHATDPWKSMLLEANLRLDRKDRSGALRICRKILKDGESTDAELLKRLLPVVIRTDSSEEILEAANRIVNLNAVDEAMVDALLSYLKRVSLGGEEAPLLEGILFQVPQGDRIGIIARLAIAYSASQDGEKLDEIADELLRMAEAEEQDRESLYEALLAVGAAFISLEQPERAMEIFERQYYLRPDKADALKTLAAISGSMEKVEQATSYMSLYYLLRPWDAENTVKLAQNWFFETGECGKAYEAVRRSHGAATKAPEETAQILIGYQYMRGDILKAINEGFKSYAKGATKWPSILFLIATLSYDLDQLSEAHRLYKMVKGEFPEHETAPRCGYLMEQIEAKLAAKKSKKARRKPKQQPAAAKN
jgi:tetratricopeptide (TPR) repeat protein